MTDSSLRLDDLAVRLSQAARRAGVGTAVDGLQSLPGGASSLTFAAELRGDLPLEIVVKVAPPGRAPVRNRDVLRQARVLRALHAQGDVAVPGVLFEDEGAPPDVPPLFVMERVAGDSLEPLFDREPTAVTADQVDRRAHHAAALLAAIQRTTVGSDHDVVTLDAELDRWAAALTTVPPAEALGWRALHAGLSRSRPTEREPVLSHGDYRLGNMVARGGAITAVIDWELWAIADPRLDLAWFRLNADPDTYGRDTPWRGAMPGPDALTRTYLDAAGGSVDALAWFDALARFKAVATWSLILKHATPRSGGPGSPFADVAGALPTLVAGAERRLECYHPSA